MTTTRSLAAVGLLTAGLVVGSTAGAVAGTVITGAQIKDGTITSADVKDGGLATRDLSPGTVKGLRGFTRYQLVHEQEQVAAGTGTELTVACPTGTMVVGGAAYWTTSTVPVQFAISFDGKRVAAYTDGLPTDDLLRVQAVCADVTP
jgi:hypothetical protein